METPTKKIQIKLPAALSMVIRSFGLNPELLETVGSDLINSGTLEKVMHAVETLERIENKLDTILAKLEENGKSSESGS